MDHMDQLILASKSSAVISLSLQDAPEALHRAVVNAVGHTGHTLGHPSLLQLVVNGAVSILESPVTVEQWMGVWIGLYRLITGLEYQRIIIPTYHIGHNAPVIEIQNGTQVDLVDIDAFIPLKLGYIGESLLIWLVRIELTV